MVFIFLLAVKNIGGPNLWGPHRIESLKGVRVRTVAAGCGACHSVIITTEGKAYSWGQCIGRAICTVVYSEA